MKEDNKSEEVKNYNITDSENKEFVEIAGDEQTPKVKKRKAVLANLLNFLAPGSGIFYAGEFKKGISIGLIWPFALLILSLLILPAIPEFYLLLIPAASITFYVSLFIYTAKVCRTRNEYILRKGNRVYLYLLFIVIYSVYSGFLSKIPAEAFHISTGSMENTLLVDDYIIVNKTAFGISIPYLGAKIINGKPPERYDVVTYWMRMNEEKTPFIHRVIGLSGDTIKVVSKAVYINGKLEKLISGLRYDNVIRDKNSPNKRIYPGGAPWNEDFYGPLYIPKKGDVINLQTENKEMWRELIRKDALSNGEVNPDAILNNRDYVIKNDYYFIMGDNRNNALDSRFTGLVSEEDIFGKAVMIYFHKLYFYRIGNLIE